MLRDKGLRATGQRVELMELLAKRKGPAGVADLLKKGSGMDTATLYRGLEALVEAGIVRRVDLRHGHADYELAEGGEHHHHIVCTKCGRVEEFDWCPDKKAEKAILGRAKSFSTLADHAFEFFGLCKRCA